MPGRREYWGKPQDRARSESLYGNHIIILGDPQFFTGISDSVANLEVAVPVQLMYTHEGGNQALTTINEINQSFFNSNPTPSFSRNPVVGKKLASCAAITRIRDDIG